MSGFCYKNRQPISPYGFARWVEPLDCGFVLSLTDDDFLSVADVNAFCRVLDFSSPEVVDGVFFIPAGGVSAGDFVDA